LEHGNAIIDARPLVGGQLLDHPGDLFEARQAAVEVRDALHDWLVDDLVDESALTDDDALEAHHDAITGLISELPGGTRALRAFNDLKNRVDDLSRKVRGIDALEQRVARLEKDVAALKRAQKPASPQKAPARKAGA